MIITKVLLEQLKKLEKFTDTNSVMPITSCFLFKDGNIYASNLGSYAMAENVVPRELSFAIDAKLIINLLGNISDYAITIETNENNGITIKSNKGTYKTVGHNIEDFPIFNFPEESTLSKLPINLNSLNLKYLGSALSKDSLRETMSNFQFYLTDNDFACVTTNAQVIICYTTTELKNYDINNTIVIDKDILKVPLDTEVTLYRSEDYVFIDGINYKYAVKIITSATPIDIRAVIPTSETACKITFNIPPVLNILNRIKSTSKVPNIYFKADAAKQIITFYFQDMDFNNSFKESIKANITGKTFITSVNIKDLSTLCNSAFKSIILENKDTTSPRPLVGKVSEYDTILVQLLTTKDIIEELSKEEEKDLFAIASTPEAEVIVNDYEEEQEEDQENIVE